MFIIKMSKIEDGSDGYLRDFDLVNTDLTPDVKPVRPRTANLTISRQAALSYPTRESAEKIQESMVKYFSDKFYNIIVVECGYSLFDKKQNAYLESLAFTDKSRTQTRLTIYSSRAYVFGSTQAAKNIADVLGSDFDFIQHVMEVL